MPPILSLRLACDLSLPGDLAVDVCRLKIPQRKGRGARSRPTLKA
jgi:hypothetical protein